MYFPDPTSATGAAINGAPAKFFGPARPARTLVKVSVLTCLS